MGYDDERLVILRMVHDGRLRPEEAASLLRALDRAEAADEERAAGYRERGHAKDREDSRERATAGEGRGAGAASFDSGGGDSRPEGEEQGGSDGAAGDRSAGDREDDEAEERGKRPGLDDLEAWLERLGERLEGARQRVEEALRAARKKAEREMGSRWEDLDRTWESLHRTVSQVISEIPQRWGRGGTSFLKMDWDPRKGRPLHTVEQEVPLPELAPGSRLEIRTRNGSVSVAGGDGPAQVRVKWHLRAGDRETAEARAGRLLRVDDGGTKAGSAGGGTAGAGAWRLETGEERGEAVDVQLVLPRESRVAVDVESANGRLSAEDIRLARLRMRTDNGPVRVERVRAGEIELESVNGALELEQIEGDRLTVRATNGPVRVRAAVRELDCRSLNGLVEVEPLVPEGAQGDGRRSFRVETVNGRVRVGVSAAGDVGYRFDLHTVEGRISLGLDDVGNIVNQGPKTPGGILAVTFDYEERPRQVEVQVRSVNGSIDVGEGRLA